MENEKDLLQILHEAKEQLPDARNYELGASVSVCVNSGNKTVRVEFDRTGDGIIPAGWQGGKIKEKE